MFPPEVLKRTVETLNHLGVSFMLTGSLASSLQGEPRASHDIDLVVDLAATRIDALIERFPPPRNPPLQAEVPKSTWKPDVLVFDLISRAT